MGADRKHLDEKDRRAGNGGVYRAAWGRGEEAGEHGRSQNDLGGVEGAEDQPSDRQPGPKVAAVAAAVMVGRRW